MITADVLLDAENNSDHILSDFNLGPLDVVPDLSDGIVLAFVNYGDATGVDGTPKVSGAGMGDWTEIAHINNPDNLSRLIVAQASGTPSGADLLVKIGGTSASNCWAYVLQLTTADTIVQYATGTVDVALGGTPLVVTFGSAPANGLPSAFGYTTDTGPDRGAGIGLEVSAPDGSNAVIEIARQAVSGTHITASPGGTLSELQRATASRNTDAIVAWVQHAVHTSMGYWGVLLKTRATLGLGAASAYTTHHDYTDFKRYDH